MNRGIFSIGLYCLLLVPFRVSAQQELHSAAEIVQRAFEQSGIQAAAEEYRKLLGDRDSYQFQEGELIRLGYEMLWAGELDAAAILFELNVEGGVLMPHLEVTTSGDGGPAHFRRVVEVRVNEPIEDSVFGWNR